jgi:hypothetical protein
MRRGWASLAVVLLGLWGCIPYVMPALEVTQPLDLSEVAQEVQAFRVDISSKSGAPCYGQEEYSLSWIPLTGGVAPAQVQAGLDSGIIIIGIALNYHFHYHDGVHVRLYRPGYDLVEFKSWQMGKSVVWVPAKDFAAREKAIDDLLSACGTVSWCQMHRNSELFPEDSAAKPSAEVPGGLRPGSYSVEHCAALAFAAQEYDKLWQSNDPSCTEDVKKRLLHKAGSVRGLMNR